MAAGLAGAMVDTHGVNDAENPVSHEIDGQGM